MVWGATPDLFKEPGKLPLALAARTRAELEAITRRLLPRGLRKELAEAMEKRKVPLIVSAAGPLQQLPFDALLVPGDPARPFLIDYLPATGIAYIPSLMVLDSQEDPGLLGPEPPIDSPSVVTTACDFLLFVHGPRERAAVASGSPAEGKGRIRRRFRILPALTGRADSRTRTRTQPRTSFAARSRAASRCACISTHTYAPSSDLRWPWYFLRERMPQIRPASC